MQDIKGVSEGTGGKRCLNNRMGEVWRDGVGVAGMR